MTTADRNVLAMSTVVQTPARVRTVEKVSLSSSTRHIVKPYLPCSCTISVTQGPSSIPNRTSMQTNLAGEEANLPRMLKILIANDPTHKRQTFYKNVARYMSRKYATTLHTV